MSNDITAIQHSPVRGVPDLEAIRAPKPTPGADPAPALVTTSEADKAAQRAEAETAHRELQQAMERLNDQVKKNSYNLNFSFDQASKHVVVKVRTASGEVVRQIPDETVLRLAQHTEDLKGLLQDQKI